MRKRDAQALFDQFVEFNAILGRLNHTLYVSAYMKNYEAALPMLTKRQRIILKRIVGDSGPEAYGKWLLSRHRRAKLYSKMRGTKN